VWEPWTGHADSCLSAVCLQKVCPSRPEPSQAALLCCQTELCPMMLTSLGCHCHFQLRMSHSNIDGHFFHLYDRMLWDSQSKRAGSASRSFSPGYKHSMSNTETNPSLPPDSASLFLPDQVTDTAFFLLACQAQSIFSSLNFNSASKSGQSLQARTVLCYNYLLIPLRPSSFLCTIMLDARASFLNCYYHCCTGGAW
jgi:hypothetical protein